MPIKNPNEIDLTRQGLICLIAGRPGVGKTTLAESAPDPLLIDLEHGIGRVEPCYRKDTDYVDPLLTDYEQYLAFLNDLKTADLRPYKSIVIDSLGKLADLMTPKVIKDNPVNGQHDGKTLSQKGYGALSLEFKEFFTLVRSFRKLIVISSHTTEITDGDIVKTRLSVPGQTKTTIWDDVDIGGYLEFDGKHHIIHFSPSEKWDAKGSHGIKGDITIPELKGAQEGGKPADNHFLTDLFDLWQKNARAESEGYEKEKSVYDEAMKILPAIVSCSTIDSLNEVVDKVKTITHGLTSRTELLAAVKNKSMELGAKYDKESGRYVADAEVAKAIASNSVTPQ